MTILTMMVLGTGHLVRTISHFPLKIPLVVQVEYFLLAVSVDFFQLIELQNPLVVSV